MALEQRVYSMLIVSASQKFNKDMSDLLLRFPFQTEHAANAGEARRRCLEQSYDFVVLNAPLKDEFGSRFCMDMTASPDTVSVMFAPADVYDDVVDKVTPHGVFVIRKPSSPSTVTQSVTLLIAARERLRSVGKKAVKAENKLDEIRTVNKAKWFLIDNEDMSENDAHKYIEKTAMDAGISKRQAAQMIIERYN